MCGLAWPRSFCTTYRGTPLLMSRVLNAMTLLHAGVDTAVIALWLGHADIRSTNANLHADMAIKQRALDLTTPTSTLPGRMTVPQTRCGLPGKPVVMPIAAPPPPEARPSQACSRQPR